MKLNLDGKRALITGSNVGIGKAIAKTLAEEDAVVVVHGLEKDKVTRVTEEIKQDGGKAFGFVSDLSTDEGATDLAKQAQESLSGVDILINNAGAYKNRGWMDATADNWAELYNINVLSVVRLVRHLVPQMKEAGWGRIIQIASGEATQPFAAMPDYAATKAAQVNLTVSLSQELADTGITVNTVSPGIVVTETVQEFFRQTAKKQGWGSDWSEIEKHIMKEFLPNTVGRLGKPEDVANVVAFLASPLSGYINGADYRIDGGSTTCIN